MFKDIFSRSSFKLSKAVLTLSNSNPNSGNSYWIKSEFSSSKFKVQVGSVSKEIFNLVLIKILSKILYSGLIDYALILIAFFAKNSRINNNNLTIKIIALCS